MAIEQGNLMDGTKYFNIGIIAKSKTGDTLGYGPKLALEWEYDFLSAMLTDPTPEGYEASVVEFNASASRNDTGGTGGLRYEWDWENDGKFDEFSTSPLANRSWPDDYIGKITLRVNDTNINRNVSTTFTIRIYNVDPIINTTNGMIDPQPTWEHSKVTFSGFKVIDPGNDTWSYFWDFDGDLVYDVSGACVGPDGNEIPTESWYYDDDFYGEASLLAVDDDGGTTNLSVPKKVTIPSVLAGCVFDTSAPPIEGDIFVHWQYSPYRRGWVKFELDIPEEDAEITKVIFNGYAAQDIAVDLVGVRLLTTDPTTTGVTSSTIFSEAGSGTRFFGIPWVLGINTVDMGPEGVTAVQIALADGWLGMGFDLEKPTGLGNFYGYMLGSGPRRPSLYIDYKANFVPGCLIPVIVKNRPPVINCSNLTITPKSLNEGENIQVSNISFCDPGNDTYEAMIKVGPYESDWVKLGAHPIGGDEELPKGLVAYWKMDEGSWTGKLGEVVDSSGNTHHGTAYGGVTTTTGKFGRAGDFDGTDDYIEIKGYGGIGGSNPRTIEAWIKTSYATGGPTIVQWGIRASGEKYRFRLEGDSNNNALRIEVQGGYKFGTTKIADGNWHHIAVSFSGTDVVDHNLYVDGELEPVGGSKSQSMNTNTATNNVWIGSDPIAFNYATGLIDEVAIFNRALSAEEIKQHYKSGIGGGGGVVLPSGLAGYWEFDEGTGSIAADSSGNKNDGTLINGPTWTTGKIGNALSFDGVDDYVEVPRSSSLKIGEQITLEAWFYPFDIRTSKIITHARNIELGVTTYRNYGEFEVQFTDGTSYTLQASSPFANEANKWYHLAGTYDGTWIRLYGNGKLLAETNAYAGKTLMQPDYSLTIGYNKQEGAYWFRGIIDDAAIFNRALSAEEIQQHYTSGISGGDGGGVEGWGAYGPGCHYVNMTINLTLLDDYPFTGTSWDDRNVSVYVRDDESGNG